MTQPEKYNDQLHIILYLQGKYDEKWALGLVDLINTTVLIDKKSQVFKCLKMNPYFGEFIVTYFEKIQPQLDRLLVRS